MCHLCVNLLCLMLKREHPLTLLRNFISTFILSHSYNLSAVQNHWVFELRPLSDVLGTRELNVSEVGPVYFLR
jgi:hypothetical protein